MTYISLRPEHLRQLLPPTEDFAFNYSDGRAFIYDGNIYYSPNCSRPVVIPPQTELSPFNQPRLSAKIFKHPVWWSVNYGWMSFIPLAPSFISLPFEPLCWMPRIVETTVHRPDMILSEKRFKMKIEDLEKWYKVEKMVVDATLILRLGFGLSAPPPPLPSSFGYDREHRTKAIAHKMISISRDWFGVWIGFFSFVLAQVETCGHRNPSYPCEDPLPIWYRHLLKYGFTEAWLDGVATSAVCSFDKGNPRCGIVMQWTKLQSECPPLKLFVSRDIPMWFVWSNKEEYVTVHNPDLAYLSPPNDMIIRALKALSSIDPGLPVANIVLKHFLNVKDLGPEAERFLRTDAAPSRIVRYLMDRFVKENEYSTDEEESILQQMRVALAKYELATRQAFEKATSLPSQGMLEKDGDYERICNDWSEFFETRRRRESELMLVESDHDRRRREARAANPPTKNTTMYEWNRICTSGGKSVYVRTRVSKRRHESVFDMYDRKECRYSSFYNEWDLLRTSAGKPVVYSGFDFDSDDERNDGPDPDDRDIDSSIASDPLPSIHSDKSCCFADTRYDTQPDSPENQESAKPIHCSKNMLATIQTSYGYVLTMGRPLAAAPSISWSVIPPNFGFNPTTSSEEITKEEQTGICRFAYQLLKDPKNISPDLDDLNDQNHLSLSMLFNWKHLTQVADDLFVFHTPKSTACNWSLGVNSPAIALYVCRLIVSNPAAHTILTVAHLLLLRCIPLRTLILRPTSPSEKTLAKTFKAESFREENYKFTVEDFEAAMLQSTRLMQSTGGRAAMLRGGILARLAHEFISVDSVLGGPSTETTQHEMGFVAPSEHHNYSYWDDHLTEDELAVMCGTYMMYTGHGKQTTTLSWFPTPLLWESSQCGFRWVEWTEKDEHFFQTRLASIRAGKAQPLSRSKWRVWLHGHLNVRTLIANNENRAKEFLNRKKVSFLF